jgi:hypothetical protein
MARLHMTARSLSCNSVCRQGMRGLYGQQGAQGAPAGAGSHRDEFINRAWRRRRPPPPFSAVEERLQCARCGRE